MTRDVPKKLTVCLMIVRKCQNNPRILFGCSNTFDRVPKNVRCASKFIVCPMIFLKSKTHPSMFMIRLLNNLGCHAKNMTRDVPKILVYAL